MKRLIFDIEVSPNIGWFWKPDKWLQLNYKNILIHGRIICIGYKWAGQHITHALTWDDKHNEKKMLEAFVKEAHKADELLTQNGDKFDIPWVRTRCLINDVPMMPEFTSIDTKKIAKGKFNFNSNALENLARELGLPGKMETGGADLWKAVLMGDVQRAEEEYWKSPILGNNPAALAKMVAYCKQDVVLLEKVWNEMNPYVKPKSHFGVPHSTCPECGSSRVVINNTRITAAGTKYVTLQCKDCGKYHSVAHSKLNLPKTL